MLGVKIEDRYAFANLEETLKVPGLSFGESGPGDMALTLGIKTSDPRMKEILAKILAVAKPQLGLGRNQQERRGRRD